MAAVVVYRPMESMEIHDTLSAMEDTDPSAAAATQRQAHVLINACLRAGTPYSPPSPPDTSSSATMSPVYPDRPIRPLPKRSLRDRLSPEAAEQIPYPSAPTSTELMFNLQYTPKSRDQGTGMQDVDRALIDAQDGYEESCKPPSTQFEASTNRDEDDSLSMISRYREFNEKGISMPGNNAARVTQPISHSITSSNNSVDGYDSFENTNNKKKRKIPVSGGLASHTANLPASLSNDLANMGISSSRETDEPPDDAEGVSQYYGSGSSAVPIPASGTGISGAGRGRYGRNSRRDVNGRSPLGVATGNNSNWQGGRANVRRDAAAGSPSRNATDHGIISAAIAEAATSPMSPSKGQENISLLEQQQPRNSAPAKTQFTFTCESDTTKAMSWPDDQDLHYDPYPAPQMTAGQQKGFSTQGTQTSPVMASQGPNGAPAQPAQPAQRKPRRSPAKRYAIAARERRLQQEYNNYHHPPREEDVWICEFCEYESIFGAPPEALVRQYEIKDRRERKRMAEKRRLLEKAKMKGRKNKKSTKNAKNNANAAAQQQYDKSLPPQPHDPSLHDTQSDEYYAEDYEEDPSMPLPIPPEVPSKIPQPVAQYGHHPRSAHADGYHHS